VLAASHHDENHLVSFSFPLISSPQKMMSEDDVKLGIPVWVNVWSVASV